MLEEPNGGMEGTVCDKEEEISSENNLGGTTFDLERDVFVRFPMAGRGKCPIHSEETYPGLDVGWLEKIESMCSARCTLRLDENGCPLYTQILRLTTFLPESVYIVLSMYPQKQAKPSRPRFSASFSSLLPPLQFTSCGKDFERSTKV